MTTMNNDTQVCVMRCFYDESGEYCETFQDDISLCELSKTALDKINFNYDISVLYSKNDVLVIGRNIQEIEEYKTLEGSPRFFHGLLYLAEYQHRHYNGYMCILANLKTLKKRQTPH